MQPLKKKKFIESVYNDSVTFAFIKNKSGQKHKQQHKKHFLGPDYDFIKVCALGFS